MSGKQTSGYLVEQLEEAEGYASARAGATGSSASRTNSHAAHSRLLGSPAGQTSTARRTVTMSPTASPSAFRTHAFTGTM